MQATVVPGAVPPAYPGNQDAVAAAIAHNQAMSNRMMQNNALFAPAALVLNTGVQVGPQPTNTQCPNCSQQIMTVTKSEPGMISWVVGCILCALGCWCCACIPCCCVDKWNSVTHTCPNCHAFVGKFQGGM